jgi:hypothetical protein
MENNFEKQHSRNQSGWRSMHFPYSLEGACSFIAAASVDKNIWDIIFRGRFLGIIGRKKEFWLLACPFSMGTTDRSTGSQGFMSDCFDRFGFKEFHAD